ncbi:MAG: O-antigen ligase family protein [Cyanobacteria bacterium P01_F01_bin.150]
MISKHKFNEWTELSFVIAYIIIYSGGFFYLFLSGGSSEGDGIPISSFDFSLLQKVFLLNYIITFSLIIFCWKSFLYYALGVKLVVLLVLLAAASFLWSAQPSVTQSRGIAIIGTTLFGLYFGYRFTLTKQLKILAIAFGIILSTCFLLAIALPKYGIMAALHAGDWRGIYIHKNVLGQTMVLSSIIFLCLSLDKSFPKWKANAGIIASLLLIILSTSTSAMVNCLGLVIIFFCLKALRFHGKLMIASVCFLIVFAAIVFLLLTLNAADILAIFGKDLTLTGRADMWPIIVKVASKNSLLGYGYGGFWGDLSSPGGAVWREYGWPAPNAHNGFLDIWVQLGLVGLGLFSISYFNLLFRGIYLSGKLHPSASSWAVLYLSFTFITNLTETSLMGQNSLNWVLFVSIGVALMTNTKERLIDQ